MYICVSIYGEFKISNNELCLAVTHIQTSYCKYLLCCCVGSVGQAPGNPPMILTHFINVTDYLVRLHTYVIYSTTN